MSYIAVNTIKNKFIAIKSNLLYHTPSTGIQILNFSPNTWVNEPTTYIECFFTALYNHKITTTPYSYSSSCIRTGDMIVTYTTISNALTNPGDAFFTSILFAIAIRLSNSFQFEYGFL